MAQELKYPQSAIEAFPQGVRLDLRTRLAIDFLKTPLVAEVAKIISVPLETVNAFAEEAGVAGVPVMPVAIAKFALDLADAVMVDAEARGWMAPMPETDELDASTKRQSRRNARFQVEGQVAGQRAMQEMAAGAIATPQGPRVQN